jgi:hypothetical protein
MRDLLSRAAEEKQGGASSIYPADEVAVPGADPRLAAPDARVASGCAVIARSPLRRSPRRGRIGDDRVNTNPTRLGEIDYTRGAIRRLPHAPEPPNFPIP